MLKAFEKKLGVVRFRCSFNVLLEQSGRILLAVGIIAVLGVLIERLLALSIIHSWTLWSFSGVVIALIILLWSFNRPSRMQASLLLDERLKLHERFSTTLAMAESEDPFARAACAESRQVAERINPEDHFPIKASNRWLYAGCAWVMVGILVLYMPQKDLLGFLKKRQQEQEQARQLETTQRDIEETTGTVKLAVRELGDPELDAEVAKLAEPPKGAKPEVAKRQTIRRLSDLSDKLKKMQSGMELGSIELMQQMLKQLRGTRNAFSQELGQALAKGNFADACRLLKEFQNQLAEGKLSEEQREALAQQLQDLARQLQKLAQENEQLEKELEKQGLDKKLAKLSEGQLREALQKQGLSAEKIEQLLQKMAACRSACSRCSGMGSAMAGCGTGAGGLSGDQLAEVTEQLDELESLRQQMMLAQASLAEINRAIGCLGEGMGQGLGCQGPFSEGLAQKEGPGTGGPGRGYGQRSIDEDGETSTMKTRVESKGSEGPAIASLYFKGMQVKGEAKRAFAEVIQAGRDRASEAISDNQIPRKYEESVKKYFGQLEQSGDK
jgi:Mg2+ and Co2+ transporter CorA